MISARTTLGLLLFVFLPVLAFCGRDSFPDYNYRMTIYLDGQAFSSVRRIEQERVTSIVDSGGAQVRRRLQGEAVIIQRYGRTYYALLTKPDNADYALLIPGAALAPYIGRPQAHSEADEAVAEWFEDKWRAVHPNYFLDDMAAASRAMTRVVGPKNLPRTLPPRPGRAPFQAWPMFVTFTDPTDPRTVRVVTPEAIGVDRITIEITDDDVTTGIEERLPSYGPESGFKQWVRSLRYGDPRQISKGSLVMRDQ